MRSGTLGFQQIRHLVLDEADEMLSRGFIEEVSDILSHVPRERQTLLFSATLPTGVEGLRVLNNSCLRMIRFLYFHQGHITPVNVRRQRRLVAFDVFHGVDVTLEF